MARPKHIVLVQTSYLALAEHFYQHLLRLGYHPKSSRSKYHYICEFLHYLAQKGLSDIAKISPKQINDYYEYISSRPSLKDGAALSQKTTHGHLRNVRDKILIVPDGKGRKRRVVPMSGGVVKDLGDYFYYERDHLKLGRDFKLNAMDNHYAFMLHSRGGRMKKWTYNKYLKALIKRTENQIMIKKEITIHSLRHSIATHLLEQGMNIHGVRHFLGHSQLETTQQYTRISAAQLQELLEP